MHSDMEDNRDMHLQMDVEEELLDDVSRTNNLGFSNREGLWVH